MDNIDKYDYIDALMKHEIFKRIEKRFNNIFCRERTTTSIVPDSIYINNSVDIGTLTYSGIPVNLNISSRATDDQSNIRSVRLDFIFKNNNNTVGAYASMENILVLPDISQNFNEYAVELLTKILDWIDSNAPDNLGSIAELIRPRDAAYLNIGDSCFLLRAVSKSSLNKKEYVEEVNRKARHILEQRRTHWVSQYKKELDRMNRLRKAIRPMPDVFFDDVIKHNIRLAKSPVNSNIAYIFTVDLIVDGAVDEMTDKQIKLDPPKEFKNHLLIFWINEDNIVQSPVFFTNPEGKTSSHLHTTLENHVCTGTTKIVGHKVANLAQLIAFKDTLMESMKTVNISSCFSSSDRRLHAKIIEEMTKVKKPNVDNDGIWSVTAQE